jgi:uncharacterized protein YlaI
MRPHVHCSLCERPVDTDSHEFVDVDVPNPYETDDSTITQHVCTTCAVKVAEALEEASQ